MRGENIKGMRGQSSFMSSSLVFFGILIIAIIAVILLMVFGQKMFGVTF